ncbi:MAG: ABC transporter ATP-binding protein/permease [Chloroflexota bacterium]|nr:ABC transporter ATP-binding protein/permease [Chloroflexota bacterium]
MTDPAAGARLPPLVAHGRGRWFGALVGIGFLQAGAGAVTAWVIQGTFERISAPVPIDLMAAAGAGVALLLVAALAAWSRRAERIWAERVGQSYVHDLRRALSRRLVRARPRDIERRSSGAVMLRFVGDLTAIRRWVSAGLSRLIVAGTASAGALVALVVLNLVIGIGVLVVVLVGAAIAFGRGSALRQTAREARRRRARLAGNIGEKIAGLAAVQAFGAGKREDRRFGRQSRKLREAMLDKAGVAGTVDAVAEATGGVALAAAVVLGMSEIAEGRASLGTIAAAMAIIGLVVPALRELGRVEQYRHDAAIAREKLIAFLEVPLVEERGLPGLTVEHGEIEIRDVTLASALDAVRARAAPGSRVAIVGPNGSGKSSLLAVIARLVDPDDGEVLIDGQSLTDHSAGSVRRAVGIVSTDVPLLRGTLDENLRYRLPDASDEDVATVRERCEIDELIARLPDGADTRIARLGAGLSAGERLRVALGRALLGDPPILLLDEVEANLDARSTEIVERVVAAHQGTVLFVTHRLEMARLADAVWHLDEGRLMAAGPTDRVLAPGAPTAALLAVAGDGQRSSVATSLSAN